MPMDMVSPPLEEVQSVVNKAADWLAALTAQLDLGQNTPHDVNDIPIVGQLQGALGDVHKAATLKEYLPLAIVGVGVVIGRPWVGLGVAVLLYLAGQDKPAPAAPAGLDPRLSVHAY
jgi:hypothetical protein